MKKIVLMVILIFVFTQVFTAQINRRFKYFDKNNKGWYYEMSFYRNGCYELTASYTETNDILFILVWSIGRYECVGSHINLIDDLMGYKMNAQLSAKGLVFTKSFRWLIGMPFTIKNDIVNFNRDYDKPTMNKTKRMKVRSVFLKKNITNYSLQTKTYSHFFGYSLDLKQKKEYVLRFKDIILSSGVFYRKGNELILHDHALNSDFYLLISSNGLISNLIPGDYSGVELK